ncbi:MAG: family metallo-hydrolase, partial [Sphingomonas bacterium]|uniref:M28 family peptidase n=1 Tax=Sphingomonas bacterium TaxID=1895847 RepID=UPI0026162362
MRALIALLAALTLAACATVREPVSATRMSRDVRVLASDAFEGRAPATAGEERTVAWLIRHLREAGAEPGGPGGSWTQGVPLVRTRLGAGSADIGGVTLTTGREIYLSTVRPVDRATVAGAPMVFVGHGVTAPERDWDDYKGVDLTGKVAVFLVNDPDFAALPGEDAAGKFGDRRMTYYGRWTYKFEEAARRGAIAALIVHDTDGAGYGWSTVTAPAGENYDIVRRPGDERVLLQGWLEGAAATRLFAAAGLSLPELRRAGRSRGFRPVELNGQTFSADLPVTHSRAESRNVLAKVTGRTHPDEVVMFGAHWDAYGIGAPDPQGRTVRPGANDDALGVAAVLEMARDFAKRPAARTVVFALWTGEERGLLGSETYAQAPVYPHATTVANLTFDILNTGGPSRDVMLVGAGQTTLEDRLTAAVTAQGRVVTPEALPERGLNYRADHFPLARQGVPTLLLMAISGAPDLVTGGRAAGQAWLDGYMRCYHQTCDAWDPNWDWRGVVADVSAMREVGRGLAESREWPSWREGAEFRGVREASAG